MKIGKFVRMVTNWERMLDLPRMSRPRTGGRSDWAWTAVLRISRNSLRDDDDDEDVFPRCDISKLFSMFRNALRFDCFLFHRTKQSNGRRFLLTRICCYVVATHKKRGTQLNNICGNIFNVDSMEYKIAIDICINSKEKNEKKRINSRHISYYMCVVRVYIIVVLHKYILAAHSLCKVCV